jgi:hypothetical protein
MQKTGKKAAENSREIHSQVRKREKIEMKRMGDKTIEQFVVIP